MSTYRFKFYDCLSVCTGPVTPSVKINTQKPKE